MATGITCSATGVMRPDSGVSRIAMGVMRVAMGIARIAAGVTRLASGASHIAMGVMRVAIEIARFATGVMRGASGESRVAMRVMAAVMEVARAARVASCEETAVSALPAGGLELPGEASRNGTGVFRVNAEGAPGSARLAQIPAFARPQPAGVGSGTALPSPADYVQDSTASPGTRVNSRRLPVAILRSCVRQAAASQRSFGPIVWPRALRSAQIRAWVRAVARSIGSNGKRSSTASTSAERRARMPASLARWIPWRSSLAVTTDRKNPFSVLGASLASRSRRPLSYSMRTLASIRTPMDLGGNGG